MSTSQLVYKPLPLNPKGDDIRVLVLDPGSEIDGLSGTLVLESLRTPLHRFEALSYVWGPFTKDEKIELNQLATLNITDNLAAALRALRNFSKGERRRIWIDAICVNQEDLDERSQQVLLMKSIYQRATLVNSWIKVDVDPDSAAFKKLISLHDKSTEEDLGADIESWTSLNTIWNDSYWNRIWIQQEITFAAKLQICLPFVHFSAYHLFHYIRISRFESRLKVNVWLDWTQCYPRLWLPIQFGYLDPSTQPVRGTTFEIPNNNLMTILRENRHLRCTDPRDRVYGLLSLANDVDTDDVPVNYRLSIPDTYKMIPIFALKKYQTLNFLADAGLLSPLAAKGSMPSWVPDWSATPTRLDWHKWGQNSQICFLLSNDAVQRTISDGDELKATGFRIAVIEEYFQYPKAADLGKCSINEIFDLMWPVAHKSWALRRELDKSYRAPFSDAQPSLLHAVILALTQIDFRENRNDESESPSEGKTKTTLRRLIDSSALDFLKYRLWAPETHVDGKLSEEGFDYLAQSFAALLLPEGRISGDRGQEFARQLLLNRTEAGHSPFVGSQGEIGLAPQCTQKEDEAWYILGCESVIILRPLELQGCYQVVGEGYLHGYNCGEPLIDSPGELRLGDLVLGHPLRRIVLR